MRQISTILAVLFLAASPASAQKAKTDKMADLRGTWTHNSGAGKVILELKEHTLRCTISEPESVTMRVEADYMITRDGYLVGMLRAKKKKGESAEDESNRRGFFCQVKKDGDALFVSGLKTYDRQEEVAKIVEGSYRKRESTAWRSPYSSDPNVRIKQLIGESEDLRVVEREWAKFWGEDHSATKKPPASAEKK